MLPKKHQEEACMCFNTDGCIEEEARKLERNKMLQYISDFELQERDDTVCEVMTELINYFRKRNPHDFALQSSKAGEFNKDLDVSASPQ